MLYDTPGLLAYSLSDKIDPAMRNLDKNNYIGPMIATQIIVEDASILGSSISRTNLQIKILVDNNLLGVFLRKPRYFRTSPELVYSFIEFSKERNAKNEDDIFLTENRLRKRYGMTPEELRQTYKAEEKYGQDEYFDK